MGKMNVTPVGSSIFVNLLETEVIKGKDTEKYSVSLLLEPTKNKDQKAFLETLKRQQEEARVEALKDAGSKANLYELPDFARSFSKKNENGELQETDLIYVTFRSKYQPKVFDKNGQEIGVDQIRGGCKVKLEYTVVPFAMASAKKIGGALYMQNIQLIETSTPVSSFAAAAAPDSSTFAGGNGEATSEADTL